MAARSCGPMRSMEPEKSVSSTSMSWERPEVMKNWKLDPALSKLATGRLELELKDKQPALEKPENDLPKAMKDEDAIRGSWYVVYAEADGKRIPEDIGSPYYGSPVDFESKKPGVMNSTHGKFRWLSDEAEYRLDPSRTPKLLEFDGVSKHLSARR